MPSLGPFWIHSKAAGLVLATNSQSNFGQAPLVKADFQPAAPRPQLTDAPAPKFAAPTWPIMVLVAVTLVILFVAAAFSVDIAYMFLANEQLHVATDAAALQL